MRTDGEEYRDLVTLALTDFDHNVYIFAPITQGGRAGIAGAAAYLLRALDS